MYILNRNRNPIIISLIHVFTISCVSSGPVSTEIDKNKNPVVSRPANFQSPYQAIDSLLNSNDSSADRNKLPQNMKNRILKTLLNEQIAIANELKLMGKLRLSPGQSYEFDLETFCVHAGVERPVKGDGLFLGEMQGDAKSWLPQILQNYKLKGISQSDAQVLVWSLLSKTRFNQLNYKNQEQLLKIFPDAPIQFGHSIVEDHAKDFLYSQLPSEVLAAKNHLANYQSLLQDSRLKYAEIERTLSPISSRSSPLEVGWLKHEEGYYIHLKADGYQKARVKIYAPEGLKANTYFEPTQHVALPGQGQRLALSTNVIDSYQDRANQYIKDSIGVSGREALFILKYPLDALKIHAAAKAAIQITRSKMKSQNNFEDDRSDAFMHFVWSAMVAREIGYGKAKELLEAHEDYPENKPAAKSMDLFNNEKGLEFSKQNHGYYSNQQIINSGLAKVNENELRWIK